MFLILGPPGLDHTLLGSPGRDPGLLEPLELDSSLLAPPGLDCGLKGSQGPPIGQDPIREVDKNPSQEAPGDQNPAREQVFAVSCYPIYIYGIGPKWLNYGRLAKKKVRNEKKSGLLPRGSPKGHRLAHYGP